MDRRHFLTLVGAAVGGIALEQAIPLGRVWSFPKVLRPAHSMPFQIIKIRIPPRFVVTSACYSDGTLQRLATIAEPRNVFLTVDQFDDLVRKTHAAVEGRLRVGDVIEFAPVPPYVSHESYICDASTPAARLARRRSSN